MSVDDELRLANMPRTTITPADVTTIPTSHAYGVRPAQQCAGLTDAQANVKWAQVREQTMSDIAAVKAGLVQRICKDCGRSFESTIDRACNECVGRTR